MSDGGTLLRVRNLRTYFDTFAGTVRAVDGLTFRIAPAQTFALVGESGCGKSVTAFSIMQLLPMPPAFITTEQFLDKVYADKHSPYGGLFETRPAPSRIELEGVNLLGLDEKQMRSYRGGKISMIFQEPMTSLNPVYTCGNQIVEAIRLHRPLAPRKARRLAVEMLARVGIPEPAQRFGEYPHQLSGGMRQRAMIAMALSCGPKLLIADEPTTALDVTIEAQILDLLKEIQAAEGLGILLITHDLAVVAETADVVGVMYASRMAELSAAAGLFAHPLHPYTRGLFRSLPRLGAKKHRLETIPGNVPNPLHFPSGCKFHPRCPVGRGLERCRAAEPPLREVKPGHWAACWQCPGYAEAPQSDPSGFLGRRKDSETEHA